MNHLNGEKAENSSLAAGQKIIDAHFHLFEDGVWSRKMAEEVGHENSAEHMVQYYGEHNFCHGIVMGNEPLAEESYQNLPPQFSYCVGLDSGVMRGVDFTALPAVLESHLFRKQCVGIKLYPGYAPVYLDDPCFEECYRLAEKYHKPVAVHMGQTAGSRGRLKYSHPLTMDDAAAAHPGVQFVMCHIGNPFLPDAAAVLEKNPNVAADLSGLVQGAFERQEYYARQKSYFELLRTWMTYVDDWDKFMFGTDFPAVNLGEYAELMAMVVPKQAHEKFFFENANRIYSLGL